MSLSLHGNAGELFAWQHDPEALGHGLYVVRY